MGRILLVDDEPGTLHTIASSLQVEGHAVWRAETVVQATEHLTSQRFDAIFTEQKLIDGHGLKVLTTARQHDPEISVVFLTAVALADFILPAIQQGAFAVLIKPCAPDVILLAARRACEHTALRRENLLFRAASEKSDVSETSAPKSAESFNLLKLLKETERTLIQRTLASSGGSQAEAARRMGISRSLLSYKINKYGIRALD